MVHYYGKGECLRGDTRTSGNQPETNSQKPAAVYGNSKNWGNQIMIIGGNREECI
jgi:hypothetical protein